MARSPYGRLYTALLWVSKLFALGAIVTLIPWRGASWPNLIGYRSFCTFTPASTFACALLAGITCTVRARLVRRRPGPAFVPIVALALLSIGLIYWTAVWVPIKAKYAAPHATVEPGDATSSASIAE